jgi:hypothetical protein
MTEQRDILYSPGYGAGWSSWCSGPRDMKLFMLTYQPIIAFIKGGGKFSDAECDNTERGLPNLHPLLRQFSDECVSRWGDSPYLGGARDLEVEAVTGDFRIHEYDGNESIVLSGEDEWF